MFLFWYCIDDHLAAIFHNPAIGHVPFWVILVATLMFGTPNVRTG